jgi:hypothetical protein
LIFDRHPISTVSMHRFMVALLLLALAGTVKSYPVDRC